MKKFLIFFIILYFNSIHIPNLISNELFDNSSLDNFTENSSLSEVVSVDDIEELSKSISDLKSEIEKMDGLNEEELLIKKSISSSLNNLEQANSFLENALEKGDIETSINAISLFEESLSKTSSLIPGQFSNDMSEINLNDFGDENLQLIQSISSSMSKNKDESLKELFNTMTNLENSGFNAFTYVSNLNSAGIPIENINIKLDALEKVDNWTKEDWANSWSGETPTVKNINCETACELVELSEDEVMEMKAQMAINFATSMGLESSNTNTITQFTGNSISVSQLTPEGVRKAIKLSGLSKEDLANSWTGSDPTSKNVNGVNIDLTEDEIFNTKAEWAENRLIQSVLEGKELDSIDSNLLDFNNISKLSETFRTAYVQEIKIDSGIDDIAAMQTINSLGMSTEELAGMWKGSDPTSKNVNGVNIDLTAEEILKTKADWVKNRLAQGLQEGKSFTDDLNVSESFIADATSKALTQMDINAITQATKAANRAAEAAAAVENFVSSVDVSDLADNVDVNQFTEAVAKSDFVTDAISDVSNNITDVSSLTEYLGIDANVLTEDVSNFTEADWASKWTGDPATHKNVNGVRIELTAEEQQKIHADWAKNRHEQTQQNN